jgi:DNA polymerase-3 subunit epsilon
MKLFYWLKRLIGLNPAPPPPTGSFDSPAAALETTSFVVLDLEATGLNPQTDEILAIGAIRMNGPRIRVGETFYRLVQPALTAWPETVPIHHILPADVTMAPPLAAILPELTAFCTGSVLVGYAIGLDRAFLTARHVEQSQVLAISLWLDIRQIAAWLAAQKPPSPKTPPANDDLSVLATYYDIPIPQKHHALADAFVTAQIWQRQLTQLQARGYTHLHQLVQTLVKS